MVELRSRVGYVSQDNYLFYGTVRENISFGTVNADDRMILRAANISGVTDFVRAHPAGFGRDDTGALTVDMHFQPSSMTADRYNVIDRLYINNNGKPNYDLELIIRFMGLFEQNAPAEKLYIRFDTAFEIARVLNSSFTYRVVARHLEDCGIGDELALFWLGGACLAYAPGNDAIIEAIKRKMTELRQSHSDLETRMSMIVEE